MNIRKTLKDIMSTSKERLWAEFGSKFARNNKKTQVFFEILRFFRASNILENIKDESNRILVKEHGTHILKGY